MLTIDATKPNAAQGAGFSDSLTSDEYLVDAPTPAQPTRPAKAWRGPRTLGEHAERALAELRRRVFDLQAQLDAARAELEAARLDGALALPGLIRREARRLGVDLRQNARDLYGAVLLHRVHLVGFHGVDGQLVDQVRNSLARQAAGEITAEQALETIGGSLQWRDGELARRLAAAKAVHPGPPANPCRLCGQELGTNAADCSPCALARPGFLVEAGQ